MAHSGCAAWYRGELRETAELQWAGVCGKGSKKFIFESFFEDLTRYLLFRIFHENDIGSVYIFKILTLTGEYLHESSLPLKSQFSA